MRTGYMIQWLPKRFVHRWRFVDIPKDAFLNSNQFCAKIVLLARFDNPDIRVEGCSRCVGRLGACRDNSLDSAFLPS